MLLFSFLVLFIQILQYTTARHVDTHVGNNSQLNVFWVTIAKRPDSKQCFRQMQKQRLGAETQPKPLS